MTIVRLDGLSSLIFSPPPGRQKKTPVLWWAWPWHGHSAKRTIERLLNTQAPKIQGYYGKIRWDAAQTRAPYQRQPPLSTPFQQKINHVLIDRQR